MTQKAYVLIRSAPGLTGALFHSLRNSPLVQSVEMITGPYDLIVALEADDTHRILSVIMNDIRPAAGVRDTITCLVVPGESTS